MRMPLGLVSTLAGNGSAGYLDGPLSLAQFAYPSDACDDGNGNVFVADTQNFRIRLININSEQGFPSFFFLLLFASLVDQKEKKIYFPSPSQSPSELLKFQHSPDPGRSKYSMVLLSMQSFSTRPPCYANLPLLPSSLQIARRALPIT